MSDLKPQDRVTVGFTRGTVIRLERKGWILVQLDDGGYLPHRVPVDSVEKLERPS